MLFLLLSRVPSRVQHLEKLKDPVHQILLLTLLFIAVHFVPSVQGQKVQAFLSVAFSFLHLQGSEELLLLCWRWGGGLSWSRWGCRARRLQPLVTLLLKLGMGLCPFPFLEHQHALHSTDMCQFLVYFHFSSAEAWAVTSKSCMAVFMGVLTV